LQILEAQDRLRLRVVKSISAESFKGAVDTGLRTGFGSPFIRIGSLKLFADGALGPQTAAMLEPYEGPAGQLGMLLLDEEEILETGRQAVANGISLAIHAIGDKAVHAVLNGYEALREYERANRLPSLRHRIEHVQLLHPADAPRLEQLGVIASMQPVHATSDMVTADRYWGPRSANAYAWRTVLSHRTALAFGSDAPVESPNPFWGLHAAVSRQRRDGSPGRMGWYPEQRLSLEEALQAYTTGPAYAAGLENHLGRLAPGYAADLIVLPQDPFDLPIEALAEQRPVATLVAGDWVWEADNS
jgi:predicted amidohydrolase YtcJ